MRGVKATSWLAKVRGVEVAQGGLPDGGEAADRRLEGALADGGDGQAGFADGVGEVVGQVHVDFRHGPFITRLGVEKYNPMVGA